MASFPDLGGIWQMALARVMRTRDAEEAQAEILARCSTMVGRSKALLRAPVWKAEDMPNWKRSEDDSG